MQICSCMSVHLCASSSSSSSSSSLRRADITDSPDSLSLSLSLSLSIICLYRSSFFASPLNGILCPHWDDEWQFLAGWPILVCACVGVHRKMLLMCSSLLHQQCPTCLARFTLMVCEMSGEWPYSRFLSGAPSRICSKQHQALLYTS